MTCNVIDVKEELHTRPSLVTGLVLCTQNPTQQHSGPVRKQWVGWMVEHSPERLLGFAREGVSELADVPSEFRTGHLESFWQALGHNSCPSSPSTRFWVIWEQREI